MYIAIYMYVLHYLPYCIKMLCMYTVMEKFGEFHKPSIIRQTKPSKLGLTINNLLADLLIRQTYFHQMFKKS